MSEALIVWVCNVFRGIHFTYCARVYQWPRAHTKKHDNASTVHHLVVQHLADLRARILRNMTTRLPPLRGPAILFAHRGAKTLERENTIDAFTLAVSLGATGLETDAWLTSDGEVVLDHDGCHRWFPRKWIRDTNRADLKEHIPTLAEFYESVGTDLPVSIDLKDPAAFAPTVELARAYGAEQRLWLCHPDLDLLSEWRRVAPDVRLVNATAMERLPTGPERRAAELSSAGIDAVNLRQGKWTGGLVALFHRFEVLAFGWDAQYERQLASLIDMGIDAVYSDDVERMVAVAATFEQNA